MSVSNEYLADAREHLKLVAPLIKEQMAPVESWQATLFAALGIEKLLKHLLARKNPALVLKSMDFESIMVNCHAEDIHSREKLIELSKRASSDVVTLRTSVLRAASFSSAIQKNAQFLHALAEIRDIAAHRPWQEAESNRVQIILCRDFVKVLSEICEETKLEIKEFFSEHVGRLLHLSEIVATREDLSAQMAETLAKHLAIWKKRKDDARAMRAGEVQTKRRLEIEAYATEVVCPACDNAACLVYDPDYDVDLDEEGSPHATLVGVNPDTLKCYFCSLVLDQYDQLRFVGIED